MTRPITMTEAREIAIQTLADAEQRREQAALAEARGSENEGAVLEAAEEALREIAILCGYPDPSDGEGTSPNEIVAMVRKRLNISPNDQAHRSAPGGEVERKGNDGNPK